MTEPKCGNLHVMPKIARKSRRFLEAESELRVFAQAGQSLRVGALMAVFALSGCDDGPKRDPVPSPPAPTEPAESKAETPLDDDAAADRYLEIKAEVDRDPGIVTGDRFATIKSDLESIANGAGTPQLRANAALLLGSLFQARGEALRASGYFQHAATLVPNDAGPHMALARALAVSGDTEGALKAQSQAATLDPDNLENWLALGELHMRAGDRDSAVQAYGGYELRRKGLIDGLTLHDGEGTYVVGVDQRVGCANALAAAADQGTGVALVYALRTDPEPAVRAEVARVMGLHRLEIYLPVLKTQVAEEKDPDVVEALQWALAEIARDPVAIDATERPRLADDDPRAVEGEVPRADAAPVAPTEQSTLAPDGTPAPGEGGAGPDGGEGSAGPDGGEGAGAGGGAGLDGAGAAGVGGGASPKATAPAGEGSKKAAPTGSAAGEG